jgi:hypothetical protein
MADEIANAQLDFGIPELWPEEALAALYQEPSLVNRVTRVDGMVNAWGDILHLPAMPTFVANDVSSDGTVANQQVSLTEVQLTVNQWREATVEVVDKAGVQSKINALEAFRRDLPRILMEDMETKLAALYADVTSNTFGDSTSVMNEDLATQAINSLLDAKLGSALRDPNRVSFVLHTSQWQHVKKVDGWSNAANTGQATGGALQFSVPSLYGIPTFFNTQIASASSARQNLLFVREAFALGIQRNFQITPLAKTKLSTRVAAHVLYGVKTRAQGRAALIKTKA